VQQNSPGPPAAVLDKIEGAAEDSIDTAAPFLVRADTRSSSAVTITSTRSRCG